MIGKTFEKNTQCVKLNTFLVATCLLVCIEDPKHKWFHLWSLWQAVLQKNGEDTNEDIFTCTAQHWLPLQAESIQPSPDYQSSHSTFYQLPWCFKHYSKALQNLIETWLLEDERLGISNIKEWLGACTILFSKGCGNHSSYSTLNQNNQRNRTL